MEKREPSLCLQQAFRYDMCSFSVHQIETHRKGEKLGDKEKSNSKKTLQAAHLYASVDFSY